MEDETDFSLFGKDKSKHDKADASKSGSGSGAGSADASGLPAEAQGASPKQVIVSRATDEERYGTHHPNIGVAIIFNHTVIKKQSPRLGTEKDRESMLRSLEAYGFDVRVYDDLEFEKIVEQLKAVAKEDHSQNDCFVLVVMSHGLEGKVYAKDMAYPVERLWSPFLGDNCPTLKNKPKLFFIQACRGQNLDKPVVFSAYSPMSRSLNLEADAQEQPQVVTYAIPNTADILVMYSTFEKYFSFRSPQKGSWFIQSLCAVLDAAAEGENAGAAGSEGVELLRLLTAVNRKVAYEFQSNTNDVSYNQMKEMPNFMSTLTKLFYLRVKRRDAV